MNLPLLHPVNRVASHSWLTVVKSKPIMILRMICFIWPIFAAISTLVCAITFFVNHGISSDYIAFILFIYVLMLKSHCELMHYTYTDDHAVQGYVNVITMFVFLAFALLYVLTELNSRPRLFAMVFAGTMIEVSAVEISCNLYLDELDAFKQNAIRATLIGIVSVMTLAYVPQLHL